VSGGDLAELPGQLAQLRELTREAHAATKDLHRAIREAKDYADSLVKLVDAAADAARRAAHAAGCEQVRELEAHLQAEMNRSAAKLNQAVIEARGHIVRAMTPRVAMALDADPAGLVVRFDGNLFDADMPAGGY
jgi:Skp family chaperone for outer membrane proteins